MNCFAKVVKGFQPFTIFPNSDYSFETFLQTEFAYEITGILLSPQVNGGKNWYIKSINISHTSVRIPSIELNRSNDTNGFLRELVSEALILI